MYVACKSIPLIEAIHYIVFHHILNVSSIEIDFFCQLQASPIVTEHKEYMNANIHSFTCMLFYRNRLISKFILMLFLHHKADALSIYIFCCINGRREDAETNHLCQILCTFPSFPFLWPIFSEVCCRALNIYHSTNESHASQVGPR